MGRLTRVAVGGYNCWLATAFDITFDITFDHFFTISCGAQLPPHSTYPHTPHAPCDARILY